MCRNELFSILSQLRGSWKFSKFSCTMDDNESSLIYQLGVLEEECSVLSLKANSRLLKDLQGAETEAYIVFTSTTSARVTIGNEEYDLSFCDTKPTDAYIQEDWIQMARLGEVQGRLQVTSSKSSGVKESAVNATIEKLNLYPEPETKKREISLLDIGAGSIPSSHIITDSNKKPKLAHTTPTTSATTPRRKPAPAYTEAAPIASAQPTFDLTSPVLLLSNVPVEVSAGDVLSTLFSGLSIAAMYVCNLKHVTLSNPQSSTAECSVQASSTVDLYVEFTFIGGAELAMMRDGEELSYKSLDTPNDTTSTNTSNTPGKSAYTRKQFAPFLQPVDQQLSFWVKSVGVKLCTTTAANVGQSLTTNTPIRKYIEVLVDTLHTTASSTITANTTNTTNTSTANTTTTTTTVQDILCDPVALARHWRDVVSQLLLPAGRIDAYSADNTQKARIFKDTEYLYRNPAVESILCAHLECVGSTSVRSGRDIGVSGGGSFLGDVGGDGLYSVDDDVSHNKYEQFVCDAEQLVHHHSTLWCKLNLLAPTNTITKSTGGVGAVEANVKFARDLVTTRLALYKALYKQAWSLSTTYSVFK